MSVELNQEELEVYTRFIRNLNKGKDEHETVKTVVVEAKRFQEESRTFSCTVVSGTKRSMLRDHTKHGMQASQEEHGAAL